MQKEAISCTHKYFQIGICEQPLHNASLKKPYFYKGNTLSKRFRGQAPHAQIQVCVSTKQSSWLGGGGNLWLLAFFAVATLFLWNAYFYSAKRRGPRTGL